MQTVVIKYGGSVGGQQTDLLQEIAHASSYSMRVVVVHGGGPEITALLEKLGHTSTFLDGHRVTDETTLEAVEMVLCGRVGKRMVRILQGLGAKAVSVSGEDGFMIKAAPYGDDDVLGYVGRVDQVDVSLLDVLLDAGYIPVVAPLGVDAMGHVRNINADLVAGSIAGMLQADAFVLATDVAGVKQRQNDDVAVPLLSMQQAKAWIQEGVITGGMIPKVTAALDALKWGAKSAHIVDARQKGLFAALQADKAFGTQIVVATKEGMSS